MIDKFNIRVYGLLLNDNKILLSHENIDGFEMTKLPGGGVELGEGILEALRREFKEELNLDILIYNQIHITEKLIVSKFKPNEQVIALYYLVDSHHDIKNMKTEQSTTLGKTNNINFKWMSLNKELLNELSFETDKQAVSELLRLNKRGL